MPEEPTLDRPEPARAGEPLFILSFQARGELGDTAARGGWRPIATRRAEESERAFLASGASVAVVDGRGAFDEAVLAVRRLAGPAESIGAAVLAILQRRNLARLDLMLDAGATHYLVSPFEPEEFATAVRFAARHAERVAGDAAKPTASAPPVPEARDGLTGIGDARTARRWIDSQLARPGPSPRCAIALVGIGRFDMINAAYGREAGDAVLGSIARRIERVLAALQGRRKLLARAGGTDFLVGIGGARSRDEAQFVAERIAEAIERPFVAADRMIELSCRVGIAADEGEGGAADLIRRAGAALALARGESGQIRLLPAAQEAEASRSSQLEIDLRTAIEKDEIDILFQPQVAVASGAIVGVEALARWRHPTLGLVGGETLFATAGRSDFVATLSRHVRRKTLEAVAGWPAELSALRVAINITASDLARAAFADEFAAAVEASGVSRDRLTVEITETDLIADLASAAAMLAALRAQALRVAVDDFGTGFSSLAYLKALPLDYLKIDRRLSQDITGSGRDRVVVRGVIEMARSLGISVIAEGVETEQQLALLAAEGCNLYQGFLCSPPLDLGELTALIRARRA